MALSFYKMFGWPTGVGCLLARLEALAKLDRPWFSGGTIVAAFVQREYYQSAPGAAHFEDGTVNYLNLPGVEIGLRFLDRVGLERIHDRVGALGVGLLEMLDSLRHADGSPAAVIYGPRTWERRGATIAFNFLHPDGRIVDERYVDRIASARNMSLRTGCFCNPGAGEIAFTIARETLVGGEFGEGMTLDDYVRAIGLPSGGAIRASLGIASNFADLYRFKAFAREFIDLHRSPLRPSRPNRLLTLSGGLRVGAALRALPRARSPAAGARDVLGVWFLETEVATFWTQVLVRNEAVLNRHGGERPPSPGRCSDAQHTVPGRLEAGEEPPTRERVV